MIYLFDKHKKLKGTVRARHTIALLYERERNGIYSVSAEIPVSLTDKRTVYNYHKKVKGSDFIGHYDREGRFQLHKIAAVDIENTSIFIKGIHLFFDEAKAGAIIRERRFRGREIIDGAREAFDTIGWSVVDFDNSDQKNYSFYNVSPLEARAILVETFGFEFDYWLDFDGKNLRNKQMAVKKKIGKETNKRYNYGHNVLSIKVEQDYSEIYTAVIGRGKGEDLDDSDGYGRRIEFTDIEWKKPSKPLDKAKGSRTLIDPNATQLFGYHDGTTVSPRTKVEIFSDIEDEAELLQASYEWLMDNNVPKAVFSLNVPDGDGLDLGDSVHVIYRDIDLIKSTRVTKVIDDLVSGNRSVEFGDTAYFETDRRISGLKAELKRVGGSASSHIARLKAEFDRRFDEEVQQWKDDFEQALIDAEADVESMRAEMTEEFETAQREFEEEFNQSVADAKKHADDVADAKAKQVQDNLDTFKGEHEFLVGELQGNIIDIDGELADAKADVSSILGRLTVVDGSISGIEGSITGITDSLSEIEGTLSNTKTQLENQVADARTELEQSISNTRTELEDKIGATEEALDKVGEDLGNAKTDLQNQLDEARAELDGLEVGGRNLFRNGDLSEGLSPWAFNGDVTLVEVDGKNAIKLEGSGRGFYQTPLHQDNSLFTISFLAKSINGVSYVNAGFLNDSKGKTQGFNINEEWTKYSFTTTEPLSSYRQLFHFYATSRTGNGLYITDLKMEKGTVATDWTPAPEDSEQKITNINQTITNIEGELSTKVEQTEVDALKGTVTAQGTLLSQTADEVSSKAEKSVVDTLTGRVTNAESSVTQNANEIAKRLTKSVYDSDKKDTDAKITQWSNTASETAEGLTRVIGRVSQTEKGVDTAQTRIEAEAGRIDGVLSRTSKVEGQVRDAELAIEANADGLALRATKTEVENAIDGIEVGGRNLLLDSTKWVLGYGDTFESNGKMYRPYGYAWQFTFYVDLVKGQAYTISVPVINRSETEDSISRIYVGHLGNFYKTISPLEDSLVSHTFIAKQDEEQAIIRILTNGNNHPIISWSYPKLEKGNKATDWTPAPEDFDASISEVTDRVTTAEAELVVQAGEISQRATQSDLDRVTGRVSTAETSIIQNADEIARRLVKSDYDSDKQATDAEITKWSNLTTETAEGLEQTISRVSTAEGKLSDAEMSIKANADSLKLTATKTEVENAIDGIEVGGRNLLENSDFSFGFTGGWRASYGSSINKQSDGSFLIQNNVRSFNGLRSPKTINVTKGETYTLTIEGARWSNMTTLDYLYLMYDMSGVLNQSLIIPSFNSKIGEFSRISYTFVATQTAENIDLLIANRPINELPETYEVGFYIKNVKIEKGNKATDWTPAPEDTEAKITKAQADIEVNADEIALKASQSDLNSVTGRVSSAESELSVQAGQIALRATKKDLDGVAGRVSATEASLTVLDDEISSVVGRVSDNETVISSVVQDVGSITSTVATLEGDVASQGSQISQTNDVISSKVWMEDIANIGANLIPFSDTQNQAIMVENWDFLSDGGSTFYTGVTESGFFTLRNTRSGTTLSMRSILFDRLVAGKEYTLSFLVQRTTGVNSAYNYTWINRPSHIGRFSLGDPTRITDNGDGTYTHEYVFTSDYTGKVGVSIGSYTTSGQDLWLRVKEPKLERGSKRTPYMTAFSVVEQRAEELSLRVQELSSINGEEMLSQSDISVLPDRVLIGSQNIGARDMASILTVSPAAIDMITDELNLTGNLNVKGQIESLSVSAVKANFGDVVAGTADIRFIQAKHLASDSVQTRHLYVDNAMAEKLIANTVMASEIRALSLTAVEANIGSIRSKILTSDVILSSHINSSTALIDKIFSSNAMFERMMAKNGFVRTLNTVTIDTDQLTIRRPDGVAWVSQGLARGHVPVQIFDNYADSSVQFTGLNFVTSSSFWKNFKYFYTPHEGSRLRVVWAVSLQTGNSASEYIEVGVDGFGNYNPINNGTGSSTRRQLVYAGQTEYITQDIPLPPPNFQTFQANLQFRRSPTGVHLDNRVTVRILHIGQYN